MPQPSQAPPAQKRVLILATTNWVSTAQLAMALTATGCRVELMAPAGHPALATDAIAAHHSYWPMLPMLSLRRALGACRPDLLLFADELSFLLVEELARWALATDSGEAAATLALLRRSFGSVECLPLTRSRMALLAAAEVAGVPIPLTYPLRTDTDVVRVTREMPGPWMLKADATWGGFGVRKVTEAARLAATWKQLQQPLGFLRSLKRGWSGKEWAHLQVWLRGSRRDVIAQSFIWGRERTGMAVCVRGRVVAAACLQVEEVQYANGPSTLLKVVEDEAMLQCMNRVAGALGLSGFCGFDFMIDAASGEPLLLEMNMRPTQIAHLPLGVGRDLCAALVREVLGCSEVADRPCVCDTGLIAQFPQEILRDPSGSRLSGAFHDVPWTAPALVQTAVGAAPLPALLTSDPRWQSAPNRQTGLEAKVHLSGNRV